MKRLLLLLAGSLLAPLLALAQTPCANNYPDDPFINRDTFAPIQRYLARCIIMNGLTEEMVSGEVPWNGTPVYANGNPQPLQTGPYWRAGTNPAPPLIGSGKCYFPADPATNTPAHYADSSLICKGYCNYSYCPVDYAKQIKLLPHLNASFIAAAAGPWGHPEYYQDSSEYLKAAAHTVTDINHAYDLKGLRRPVIQAAIYENIDGQPSTSQNINNLFDYNVLYISPVDIEACRALIPANELATYFTGSNYQTPRTDVLFTWAGVAYDPYNVRPNHWPDILKTQGLLWMHYQARCYIERGYTALHMGQMAFMAGLIEPSWNNDQPTLLKRMRRMYKLVSLIRQRAAQRPCINFILITAEPFVYPVSYNQRSLLKYALPRSGGDTLIFDFNLAAARFLPVNTNGSPDQRALLVSNTVRCAPYDGYDLQYNLQGLYLGHPECFNNQNRMAIFDPCHSMNMLPDGGGISPTGLVYPSHTPYLTYVDHGNTEIDAAQYNDASRDLADRGVWHYDDSGWFTFLEDNCKNAWLDYELKEIRRFTPANSFFEVPGRLVNSPNYPLYKLRDHPSTVAAVKQAWTPQVPSVEVGSSVICSSFSGKSTGSKLPGGPPTGPPTAYPTWTFAVTNPSPSSTYTWHIKRPDGSWEPYTYGTWREYHPTMTGQYVVGVRQDDFGLPNNDWGRGYDVDPTLIYASRLPCETAQRNSGASPATLTQLTPAQLAQLSQGTGLRTTPQPQLEVSLSPVPAQQELVVTVNSPATEDVLISVVNALGQEVGIGKVRASLAQGQCAQRLDVSALPAGFYLVQVTQGQARKTTRFVK